MNRDYGFDVSALVGAIGGAAAGLTTAIGTTVIAGQAQKDATKLQSQQISAQSSIDKLVAQLAAKQYQQPAGQQQSGQAASGMPTAAVVGVGLVVLLGVGGAVYLLTKKRK